MDDSKCPIPKTPQQVSIDRGGVKRPNRMSLLLAGKSNLFNTGDSDFNFVNTPDHIKREGNVEESPAQTNPVDLVHQISDLQKALRTVTNELECTKKMLAVETRKRRELEKSSSSPTSVSEPFLMFDKISKGGTNQQKIGFKILDGVSKMAHGITELQESIKLSLSMSFNDESDVDDLTDNGTKNKLNRENSSSSSSSNDTINGSQQSANTTRSTYPAENHGKNQINSFQKSLKNPSGTPTRRKDLQTLHPDVFCGHGTPEWCQSLNIGDEIDARDSDKKWYKAVVVDTKYEDLNSKIKIHFIGWDDEWDLWMNIMLDIANLAPSGVHTAEEWIGKGVIGSCKKKARERINAISKSESSKDNGNCDNMNESNNTDSKLQSQDENHHQSHSPGGMEISLSPVVVARTPNNNYRSASITYV